MPVIGVDVTRARLPGDLGAGGHGVMVGDRHDAHAGGSRVRDQFSRGEPTVRRGRVEMKVDEHSRMLSRAALTLHEGAVFADEQVEMGALFVGELQEDLLAFGVLETLAVFLEEAM